MHVAKSGLRALGIAESYSGREQSTLAGVVMRKDLLIDGVAFARVTVGGCDATDAVIRVFTDLARRDINLLMLSGSVIAWYNIIDPVAVQDATGLPIIVTTYEESEGLEEDRLCNDFTREGRVPEPVRVARLVARGVVRSSAPDDHDR
ncbi:MAG: hypothetical protein XD82_1717 [Methanoculleus marisnigri]|uniref:Uncharacterized protein n=1 Tax=Methanoculleus marisnigri TaxID=2198 RepID=A0A101GKC8_9EURY|nr:MAG: hypothetical protein XD82_1717 [Methanoculleus marisnigri]